MNIHVASGCALATLIIATGCAHNSLLTNTPNVQTIEALNSTANDTTASADERCNSVFDLFQHYIKPGSTPQEIHEVLTDTRWLDQTNIHGCYIIGGLIPVETKTDHTPFVIFVLPSIKPSTGRPPNLGYHIYLSLAGAAPRPEESAFAILTGQEAWNTNAILTEFALCYPDGTTECFTKSGIRKFNVWPITATGSKTSVSNSNTPPFTK